MAVTGRNFALSGMKPGLKPEGVKPTVLKPVGMRQTRSWLAASALLLCVGTTLGQELSAKDQQWVAVCMACHGPGGNSPGPQVPSLAGQPKIFLETQMVLIREGLREIPVKGELLKPLKDDEINRLSAHFSAQPLTAKTAAGDNTKIARGQDTAKRMLCGTCHLPDYAGQQQVPRLAGQHSAYLVGSMKQLRDAPGPGRDTIMSASLLGLKDVDLEDLADYFASLKPSK